MTGAATFRLVLDRRRQQPRLPQELREGGIPVVLRRDPAFGVAQGWAAGLAGRMNAMERCLRAGHESFSVRDLLRPGKGPLSRAGPLEIRLDADPPRPSSPASTLITVGMSGEIAASCRATSAAQVSARPHGASPGRPGRGGSRDRRSRPGRRRPARSRTSAASGPRGRPHRPGSRGAISSNSAALQPLEGHDAVKVG